MDYLQKIRRQELVEGLMLGSHLDLLCIAQAFLGITCWVLVDSHNSQERAQLFQNFYKRAMHLKYGKIK